MYSIVCEQLQCRKAVIARYRSLAHQHSKPGDRGDVTHRLVVAELVLTT